MHENGKVGFSWHETIMHENGKVRFFCEMKRSCMMKMEKFVFRGMKKKKRGSKKLVVCGVTHWIKFEDDGHQTNFFGRCNLYITYAPEHF